MMEQLPPPEQNSLPPISPEQPGERPPFLRRISPAAFALLALGLIFFLYQIVGGGITLLLMHGSVTDMNVGLMRWTTLLGQLLFILLPTLLLARARYPELTQVLRLRVPHYREIIVTTIAMFALQQIMQGYMALQDSIPLPPELQKLIETFREMIDQTYRVLVTAKSPRELLFVVITVALVPAICEEVLFRGVVQGTMEEAVGGVRAAVIAGVIFGAYHLNPFSLVPLVVLGIYFGYLVYRSGSIAVSISAHFFNNFVACVAIYLNVNDDFIALAPNGSPTWPVLLANFALFGVVFVAATYYFIVITRREDRQS
jgi:membrane protease YdiL (CAAX protease family)